MAIKDGMRPIHPGEILREEFMLPMNLSSNALAKQLKITPTRVNEICREKRGVTGDTALRLARYFGTTPDFWLYLQYSYDLRVSEKSMDASIEEITPAFAE